MEADYTQELGTVSGSSDVPKMLYVENPTMMDRTLPTTAASATSSVNRLMAFIVRLSPLVTGCTFLYAAKGK